ncbi:MAG: LmeA family phospholipid-binding protein [Pseudonocardiaceae bacterium]
MRKLVIALLVLAGLLVAADFGAAAYAEYQVAERLRTEFSLTADPSVRINGFPFITQALSGSYDDIDMRAGDLAVGPLRDVAVEASMYDVDAPLDEVTSGSLSSVKIDEVEGRVRILDKDLGRAIGIEDLRIAEASDKEIEEALGSDTVSDSESDGRAAVRMIATTDLGGERAEVIVVGLLELADGAVSVTPTDVRLATDDVGEFSLPADFREPLLAAFSTEVDPGGLPFTVTPTAVDVDDGAIVVEGTAREVSFSQAGAGVG